MCTRTTLSVKSWVENWRRCFFSMLSVVVRERERLMAYIPVFLFFIPYNFYTLYPKWVFRALLFFPFPVDAQHIMRMCYIINSVFLMHTAIVFFWIIIICIMSCMYALFFLFICLKVAYYVYNTTTSVRSSVLLKQHRYIYISLL